MRIGKYDIRSTGQPISTTWSAWQWTLWAIVAVGAIVVFLVRG